jgi:hypothetical protein
MTWLSSREKVFCLIVFEHSTLGPEFVMGILIHILNVEPKLKLQCCLSLSESNSFALCRWCPGEE